MRTTKEFVSEVKDIVREDVKDGLVLLKGVGKELSGEAQEQRDRFAEDFNNTIKSLTDKEKQFLVDVIEQWWAEGFDFSIGKVLEKEFPDNKDSLNEIFSIISRDGIINLNEGSISLKLDIKALHDSLDSELANKSSQNTLSQEIKTDKENNLHKAEPLIKQLNKEESIESKENPILTAVIAKLQELLKDEQAYRHTKLVKDTISLLNKNQNINEGDEHGHPVLNNIIALSYYPLGQEALETILKDESLDVNAHYGEPLSLAISNRNLKAMELLLARKDLDVMAYSKDPEIGKDSLEKKIGRLGDRNTFFERVGKAETRFIKRKMIKLLKSHPSYKENIG